MTGLIGHLAYRLQASRIKELDISLVARRYQVMTNSLGKTALPFRLHIRLLITFSGLGAPNLIPVLALGVYAATLSNSGQTLSLYQAFTALSFVVLITFPIGVLLQTAPLLVMALASLNQIDTYVRREQNSDPNVRSDVQASRQSTEKAVSSTTPKSSDIFAALDCSLKYPSSKGLVLRELNFSATRSAFTFILGPSASGKTTLLEALLGELQPCTGSMSRAADAQDVAYMAQTPWIRNTSVKSNIVQGLSFDEKWYAEVIHAVALDKDLHQISRDQMGSAGAALSGGQKQKVVSCLHAFESRLADVSS